MDAIVACDAGTGLGISFYSFEVASRHNSFDVNGNFYFYFSLFHFYPFIYMTNYIIFFNSRNLLFSSVSGEVFGTAAFGIAYDISAEVYNNVFVLNSNVSSSDYAYGIKLFEFVSPPSFTLNTFTIRGNSFIDGYLAFGVWMGNWNADQTTAVMSNNTFAVDGHIASDSAFAYGMSLFTNNAPPSVTSNTFTVTGNIYGDLLGYGVWIGTLNGLTDNSFEMNGDVIGYDGYGLYASTSVLDRPSSSNRFTFGSEGTIFASALAKGVYVNVYGVDDGGGIDHYTIESYGDVNVPQSWDGGKVLDASWVTIHLCYSGECHGESFAMSNSSILVQSNHFDSEKSGNRLTGIDCWAGGNIQTTITDSMFIVNSQWNTDFIYLKGIFLRISTPFALLRNLDINANIDVTDTASILSDELIVGIEVDFGSNDGRGYYR